MKRSILAVAFGGMLSLCAGVAVAGPTTDRLGQCLVENASPKDQAALVRWMFAALSANPLLSSVADVTVQERDSYNKALAATFERLALEDCRSEFVAAAKADGMVALEEAFELMGERAAAQLMSDPAAAKELERFTEYLTRPNGSGSRRKPASTERSPSPAAPEAPY